MHNIEIVSVPALDQKINRRGESIQFTAWLPPEANNVEVARFERLQSAYKGQLRVINEKTRGTSQVVIEWTVTVHSNAEARRLVSTLRRKLDELLQPPETAAA